MRTTSALLASLALPAAAQVAPGDPAPIVIEQPRLDGQLRLRRALFAARGPGALGLGELLDARGAGVVVALRRALTDGEAERLGLTPVDATLAVGRVPWGALDRVARHPAVERVEPGKRLFALRPLETIGAQQGSLRTHLRPADGQTGEGVVVAAIDQPVDVLHPHFFFADGGVFEWLDADNSGDFAPGDAVLFDDATVGRLQVLDGFFFDPVTDPTDWQNFDGLLDPRRDWLFADLNGDGIRNAGERDGFDDDSPSLGEPIFVVDDADGDGRLDPEEKLVMLGTSKVRQMWIEDQVYARGLNLARAAHVTERLDASHGTGVASILLGGQPGFHDRVGLAPGAEYVGYANVDEARMGLVFADAEERGAMLMLHEWSQPVGVVGDGGSVFERAMDAARERGMLQVCPLGNLNRAGKQIEVTAAPAVDLTFRVGDGFFNGRQTVPFGLVQAHVAWAGGQAPASIRVTPPDGAPVDLQLGGQPQPLGDDTFIATTFDRGGRGAGLLNLLLFRGDGYSDPLPLGAWQVSIEGLPEGTVVHGRITDAWSGWSEGVGWTTPTLDRTSLTYPSTADSAIGVAAFGGRLDMRDFGDSDVGALRHYSGRGPRVDGARAVDITAPDDPLAAMATSPALEFPVGHSSGFAMFGGTSGAGPHVAATLALLHAAHPDWDADALEARLYASAERAELVPAAAELPDDAWGHGKLTLHGALYDVPPPSADRPPEAPAIAVDWQDGVVVAEASAVDPEGEALWYRWDVGYDGDWDADWSTTGQLVLADAAPGDRLTLRLAVRDPVGGAAALIATVEVPPEPVEPPAPDAQPADAASLTDGGVDAAEGDAGEALLPPVRAVDGADDCATRPGSAPRGLWLLALLLLGWRRRR